MKYEAGINVIQKADTPIHDWHRFVLSYPPPPVRQSVDRIGFCARDLLCDPFCGTGTTLVEAKKYEEMGSLKRIIPSRGKGEHLNVEP
ncbi:MAG: hypothetical protein ACLP0A_18335 [Verrucomicrobiia bacterium]